MKIKKGLESQYKEFLINNINAIFEEEEPLPNGKKFPKMPTTYVMGILFVTELVGEALDDGETPEQAEKQMNGHDLTGFMAGCVAEAVAYYHERGEEFRLYWNSLHGVSGEAKGVVNPAIVTIEPKAKKAD